MSWSARSAPFARRRPPCMAQSVVALCGGCVPAACGACGAPSSPPRRPALRSAAALYRFPKTLVDSHSVFAKSADPFLVCVCVWVWGGSWAKSETRFFDLAEHCYLD